MPVNRLSVRPNVARKYGIAVAALYAFLEDYRTTNGWLPWNPSEAVQRTGLTDQEVDLAFVILCEQGALETREEGTILVRLKRKVSGKEADDPVLQRYYEVIGRYKLPVPNHLHIKARARAMEEEIGRSEALHYLGQLLTHDYQAQQGDFKPSLTHSRDIYDKRVKIQHFLKGNRPTTDGTRLYDNRPLFEDR